MSKKTINGKEVSTVLFAMPLKKDKVERYKIFLNECLGPRRKEYKDLLKRYGLNSVKIWIHNLSGKNYALFVHEMDDDAGKRLAEWTKSTHPFDQWFDKHLRECYEIENLDHMPTQPSFLGELDGYEKD